MKEKFLSEYSSADAIRRYTKETAGDGINYLLENVYGPIYLDVIKQLSKRVDISNGLRLLEFGCGGGMNLIFLANFLAINDIKLNMAYGTDFSEKLIYAARDEATNFLNETQSDKVKFYVASNENLLTELSSAIGSDQTTLSDSFHLVLGINTFRYCHRLKKEKEGAKNVFELLVNGGSCIIIDMNARFPFFRSKIRDRLKKPADERYLPSLDEYTHAFESAGFEIIAKRNFCWIPHSARGLTFTAGKVLVPILDRLVPNLAMRSLVIAQKPL